MEFRGTSKQEFKPSNRERPGPSGGQEPQTGGAGSPLKNKKLVIIAVSLLIVILAVLAGFFYYKYANLKANPDSVNQETTQRLITKVGALYQLPDEEPTVAQISDKEKLKDQQFFQNANNGDYLLIFTNAKLAILYREQDNRLVNVGPIAISSENEESNE